MVPAARRGHPELAWGNVVGTVVILLGVNLGVVALVQPLVADPLVVRLHAPYLVGCILLVGGGAPGGARARPADGLAAGGALPLVRGPQPPARLGVGLNQEARGRANGCGSERSSSGSSSSCSPS